MALKKFYYQCSIYNGKTNHLELILRADHIDAVDSHTVIHEIGKELPHVILETLDRIDIQLGIVTLYYSIMYVEILKVPYSC